MSFVWDMPTRVIFGAGKLNDLANEDLPGNKAMIVISNGKSARENGSLDRLETILKGRNIEYVIFDKVMSNPVEAIMMEGIELGRREKVDFLIGLGGGSVLDSTTVIAAMIPQRSGRVWDYINGGTGGGKTLEEKSLPYVEITTTAGTGSEVDAWGVVSNPDTEEKIGFKGAFPTLSVIDPELMLSVPQDVTRFTGFDALLQALEGYIANTRGECGQMVQLAAIGNIAQFLPVAIENGEDLDARTKLAYANMMSGLSMVFGSCTSEHAIEHALSARHPDLPHGAGLIMICEEYFRYFIENHACDDRFLEMALALGQINIREPMDFLRALKRVKDECGVSDLKMSDYGITFEELPEIAKQARLTMGGLFACDPVELPEEAVLGILEGSYM
ncbi:MAG: iron-containing alcohol dehydrogenase [Clostridiales bacterium]|nr:iron-containing alcohol dehydrogenase [Clostridiales bacterium]MBS5877516.1 iron-containing alcohol dehydrogenase [Clostridiales bacterium]